MLVTFKSEGLEAMGRIKQEPFLNNTRKRILFIVSAFFLMYLVSYIIDPYSVYWQGFFNRDKVMLIEDVLMSLFCSIIISEFSIFISKKLNTLIPWTERPAGRLISETAANLSMVLLVNFIITFFCIEKSAGGMEFVLSHEETKGLIHWIVVSSVIAFMFMGINTGNYLILNWKNAALEAAELNQVAMEAELQALKLQIDPHFVFNNLSVLSELILEDQQLGYNYAENFSKIYRYMLVSSKKDVILLEDELRFLDAYMFLIKHRIGEGVQVEVNVDKTARSLFLPPMTLQLLVENAFKHNKVGKKHPLSIRIYNNGSDELMVENTLSPIEKSIDSSGIGIKNIRRRYSLLSEKEPVVTKGDESFVVTLPLLKI